MMRGAQGTGAPSFSQINKVDLVHIVSLVSILLLFLAHAACRIRQQDGGDSTRCEDRHEVL